MRCCKKYLLLLGLLLLAVVGGCGGIGYEVTDENKPVPIKSPEGLPSNPKILIVYFSHTGNTQLAAWQVQAAVGGQLFELQTAEAYPDDAEACGARARQELKENIRPALASDLTDISRYDTIFIGYPIWYGRAPMAVQTFLTAHDFRGKVLVPFATSNKSGIEKSVQELQAVCPQADFARGLALQDVGTGKMQRLISSWLEGVRGEVDAFNKKRAVQ